MYVEQGIIKHPKHIVLSRFEDFYTRLIGPKPVVAVSNSILSMDEELKRYWSLPPIGIDGDPLQFWSSRQQEFPNLSKLAQKYLATPPSSVYSERTFSELGQIYGEKRTSLLPERSEQLLFLHHNLRRINKNP